MKAKAEVSCVIEPRLHCGVVLEEEEFQQEGLYSPVEQKVVVLDFSERKT